MRFFKRSEFRCKARCTRSLLLLRNFGAEKSLRWSIPLGNQPASFKPIRPEEPLHFLSIPGTDALRKSYKQAELNDHDYPDLIKKDEPVATLSVGTVLAVYNWPPNSERHRKITRFVQALFRQMDELRFPTASSQMAGSRYRQIGPRLDSVRCRRAVDCRRACWKSGG